MRISNFYANENIWHLSIEFYYNKLNYGHSFNEQWSYIIVIL